MVGSLSFPQCINFFFLPVIPYLRDHQYTSSVLINLLNTVQLQPILCFTGQVCTPPIEAISKVAVMVQNGAYLHDYSGNQGSLALIAPLPSCMSLYLIYFV